MKTKGASLPIIGNPVAWRRIEDPDHVNSVRRDDCRAYDRCLRLAAESGWRGFTCNQCTAYQAPTPDEQKRDMMGALTLLEETQLLPALAEEPIFVDETEEAEDAADDAADLAHDDEDPHATAATSRRRLATYTCN